MSGTITLAAGQVFTGGTSLSGGDTGTIALTSVGSVAFDTAVSPPTIADVTITQDAAASSVSQDGLFIQSVTIDSVTPNSVVTLTTADLPPGITVPSGFTLPQNVEGTTLGVSVVTNDGIFTGTAGLYGIDGSLALVAVQNVDVDGLDVNAGAAILSLGTQATGVVSENFTPDFSAAPCFAGGTRIRTPDGDVAVEALRTGDLVSLAGGDAAPVVWLGHRRVDCHRHPRPWDVWPVRVRADAFGPGTPARDLRLSPDHAVFVDGVLIPVRYLLNGATIVQERAESIDYWHVELGSHDVLLAEGLTCESYLDTGNRVSFANGGGAMQMHADFALKVWEAKGCAPLVCDGAKVVAARSALLERAKALGCAVTDDPGLHVLVGRREMPVEFDGRRWRVRLPQTDEAVRLVSRVWIPAHMRPDENDTRSLGVAVSRLWLDNREVSLDSPGLSSGWQAPEPAWRWTDGDAVLGLTGVRELAFEVAMTGTYWRDDERGEARAA